MDIVDFIDVINLAQSGTRETKKVLLDKIKQLAENLKNKTIVTNRPIWTATQTWKPLPGGAGIPVGHTFNFKINKAIMGLTMQQRKNHDPHEIGINDLLANYFKQVEKDELLLSNFGRQNFPSLPERYEITMGRDGIQRDFSNSWLTVNHPKLLEEKRAWLDRAIEQKKIMYGHLFSPGTLIEFNDTAEVYEEKQWPIVSEGEYVHKTYYERDLDYGCIDSFSSPRYSKSRNDASYDPGELPIAYSYCHSGDTALVIKERIVARRIISNPDDWAGVVRFYREIELLLTRYSDGQYANSAPVQGIDKIEPRTTRVKIIISPHNVSGPGQQARLFKRLSDGEQK